MSVIWGFFLVVVEVNKVQKLCGTADRYSPALTNPNDLLLGTTNRTQSINLKNTDGGLEMLELASGAKIECSE